MALVLRIHFTGEDLARTYVAERPAPLWEMVFSLHMLQARYAKTAFADWRRQTRTELHRRAAAAGVRRKLMPLIPDGSYFPDFLTPTEGLLGVGEGIDAVLATPRDRVRHELDYMQQRSGTPPWAWDLAERPPRARAELGALLHGYYRDAVAPHWPRIGELAAADRAHRMRALRGGGIEGLLSSFGQQMRWRSPVLEIPKRSIDLDLHLAGRGLVLVPSYFCWQLPVSFADPGLPPTLLYPIMPSLRGGPARLDTPDALVKLLGKTRAAILQASARGPNTTEIARELDIAPATVSQHTAVLREAGLLVSHRHANSVLHTITPLGAALLRRTGPER